MHALTQIDSWPAGRVAAAVVVPGDVHRRGDGEDRFQVASVTKLFSAYAVLVACEEGSVALDDPVGPVGSTLRHLLAHASGLSPDDPARVLAAPGARRIYSNAGFEVLARHVADRSGFAFADYVREAVFEPLAMSATLGASAAFGAEASLDDLVRFANELLRPTLIDPATLREATVVAFPRLGGVLPGVGRQDPNDWGLGFELRDHKSPHWTGATNSPGTFGHFGRRGSFCWLDPLHDCALVALSDREFGPWALAAWPQLADAVLAERSDNHGTHDRPR